MQSDLMRTRNLSLWKKIYIYIYIYLFIAAGRDLDTTLYSSFCSCILFAIVEQLIKLKFLVQQVEWLILNKWRRLFHSPRVKFPLVNMSASRCLVSICNRFEFFLVSKIILSNNQSRATLWVRETCLVVGLRPLIIILITASMSPKAYNTALEPECVAFGGMWSMFVRMTLVCLIGMGYACLAWWLPTGFPVALSWVHQFCSVRNVNTSITKSQRVKAGILSVREPTSREMISSSVELCETEVCFLHIQLVGTNVWLPKMHRIPPDVDFQSSRSHAKS